MKTEDPETNRGSDDCTDYRILFVCTSTADSSWGAKTGVWLEELATPYYLLEEAGYSVELCSVKGGEPPLDPAALVSQNKSEFMERFLADPAAQEKMRRCPSLRECIDRGILSSCVALYLVGGHGCVDDFYHNADITAAVERMYNEIGGCVGAICHAPLGFADCQSKGKHMLSGKFVAAFSNEEETQLGLECKVTVLTEQVMDDCGAICVPSSPW